MARTVRIPRNRDVDENVSILVIPKEDLPNPAAPSVAVLAAAPDMTFEHTTDGAVPTASQTTKDDPRYAQRNVQTALDKTTRAFAPTYFVDDEELELDPLMVEGAELYYVFRYGVHIEDDFAVGQKVDVWPITVGLRSRGVATGGKLTRTATLAIGTVIEDAVLVA